MHNLIHDIKRIYRWKFLSDTLCRNCGTWVISLDSLETETKKFASTFQILGGSSGGGTGGNFIFFFSQQVSDYAGSIVWTSSKRKKTTNSLKYAKNTHYYIIQKINLDGTKMVSRTKIFVSLYFAHKPITISLEYSSMTLPQLSK